MCTHTAQIHIPAIASRLPFIREQALGFGNLPEPGAFLRARRHSADDDLCVIYRRISPKI
jgi:hypothetical protein